MPAVTTTETERVPLAGSLAIAGGLVAVGIAIAIGAAPILGGVVAGALLLVLVVACAPWLPSVFLTVLAAVLAGYAFVGRSFAYLGVPPLFVGELALLCGIAAALTSGALPSIARQPQVAIIVLLWVLGAARTLPYLGAYGIDALRDVMLWGYSVFAIAVAACVLATNRFDAIVATYRRFAPWYVVWVPLAVVAAHVLGERMPQMPGTGLPLLTLKLGDMGVHLAGLGAFVLADAAARARHVDGHAAASRRWIFWLAWLGALACVLAKNRGGFIAVLTAMAVVAVLDPFAIGRRVAAAATLVVLLSGAAALAVVDPAGGIQAPDDSEGRQVSPAQMTANLLSLVGAGSAETLSATRQWRLDWWTTIVAYTVRGPYFWTGKGFGVNLADEDGFQVASADSAPLRSPHNAHLTVLARTGVPGTALWVLLQVTFGVALLRSYLSAVRHRAWEWARLDLWLLAYWTAFVVNASFDVFLEGPQGGIWFWSLVGLGLAAIRAQALRVPARPERSRPTYPPAHGPAAGRAGRSPQGLPPRPA